jgi:hypothetical protein
MPRPKRVSIDAPLQRPSRRSRRSAVLDMASDTHSVSRSSNSNFQSLDPEPPNSPRSPSRPATRATVQEALTSARGHNQDELLRAVGGGSGGSSYTDGDRPIDEYMRHRKLDTERHTQELHSLATKATTNPRRVHKNSRRRARTSLAQIAANGVGATTVLATVNSVVGGQTPRSDPVPPETDHRESETGQGVQQRPSSAAANDDSQCASTGGSDT